MEKNFATRVNSPQLRKYLFFAADHMPGRENKPNGQYFNILLHILYIKDKTCKKV